MRDAFAAVELIHSFLDCREKFNPLGDFTQRNLVGQLANGIQYNFFLRHVVNMPRPSSQSKLEGSARRIAIGFGRQLLQSEQPTELRSLRSLLSELPPSSDPECGSAAIRFWSKSSFALQAWPTSVPDRRQKTGKREHPLLLDPGIRLTILHGLSRPLDTQARQ